MTCVPVIFNFSAFMSEYTSIFWIPEYYGYDPSFMIGVRDLLFVEEREGEFMISSSDDAFALIGIFSSIHHPEYGGIKGVCNTGLDLIVVQKNGCKFTINAEEEPGLIGGESQYLSNLPFEIKMKNAKNTHVTLSQYRSLFNNKKSSLLREYEEKKIMKELGIYTG